MRRRFFVEQFEGDRAVMEGAAAHHLGRVLRAERGQLYELSDGKRVCLARIEEVKRDRVEFSLIEELPTPKPTLKTTLLLSIVKFEAFEFALEKATELGIGAIVPLAAARSEKGLLTAAPKRAERWKKILLEASQQSRRLRIPTLEPLTKPETGFAARSGVLKILLSERPAAPSLRSLVNLHQETRDFRRPSVLEKNGSKDPPLREGNGTTVTLAIGPEGGWTDPEFQCAQHHGFREASLGQLILRTETAVIAALAALNYALNLD